MKKLLKMIQFGFIFFSVCCCLFFVTMFIIIGINLTTGNMMANVNIERVAEAFQQTEDGYVLPQEAQAIIDAHNGFAILIGEDGQVLWSYRKPSEIPVYYTRAEIASFSRWYLKDYPVSTWIVGQNIFVIGQPRNTVWKYEISYGLKTMAAYIVYLPALLLFNLFALIVSSICLYKKSTFKREQQRIEWIAGVSHDVRTPLALVLGNALAIKDKTDDALILEKVNLIEKHALRMRTLISNLNMENKLSYGLGKWNREEIVFSTLIRDVICDVMNQEENELFYFDVCIAQDLEDYRICADLDLARRLLENLVWNAIRHNPQGCCIHVSLQRNQKQRKNILFTLSDDGKGVSPEQLRLLNEKRSVDTLPEHGLGIRLVKRIAALYHWKLVFSPSKESGLTCTIVLNRFPYIHVT